MDVNETGPTRAELVDRLLEAISSGQPMPLAIDSSLRPLAETAGTMRDALVPVPVSIGFERRLAQRLAAAGRHGPVQLRLNGRLIVTGAAVSSAVGVGVTAYAVWRSSRRQPAHRFWQR